MDEAENWINEILNKHPELDNMIGLEALIDAINHSHDPRDSAVIELALYYLKSRLQDIKDSFHYSLPRETVE